MDLIDGTQVYALAGWIDTEFLGRDVGVVGQWRKHMIHKYASITLREGEIHPRVVEWVQEGIAAMRDRGARTADVKGELTKESLDLAIDHFALQRCPGLPRAVVAARAAAEEML